MSGLEVALWVLLPDSHGQGSLSHMGNFAYMAIICDDKFANFEGGRALYQKSAVPRWQSTNSNRAKQQKSEMEKSEIEKSVGLNNLENIPLFGKSSTIRVGSSHALHHTLFIASYSWGRTTTTRQSWTSGCTYFHK